MTRAIEMGSVGTVELEPLAARFGEPQSNHEEEWILRDFFDDRRDGIFLDVGASDYRAGSNTYFLETALGWHGLAVDAQADYADGYREHRPNTRFFSLFVSDVSDAAIDFHVPADFPYAASDSREFATAHRRDGDVVTRRVPTITLNDLLEREGITRVHLLSMDIELAEPRALAGFDIERYLPELVCIEAHPQNRQTLLNYFADHGYVVVGKYLRMDPRNLYFTPRASVAATGG